MSDDEVRSGKTDWSDVNNAVRRREHSEALPIGPAGLTPSTSGLQKPDGSGAVQPEGVIANFKANAITKKAAVTYLKMYYEQQLDASRHHLQELVRVRKAESTAVAEQMLASINSQQMRFLVDVGLKNEAVRNDALVQLNNQTSATLRQIVTADWPETLRQQAIEGIIERNGKFFGKLMTDLGEK
jgi:hypothetical protein